MAAMRVADAARRVLAHDVTEIGDPTVPVAIDGVLHGPRPEGTPRASLWRR